MPKIVKQKDKKRGEIKVRLTLRDKSLFKELAENTGITISEHIRTIVKEKLREAGLGLDKK